MTPAAIAEAARRLVREYGWDAPIQVAMKVDEALAAGDDDARLAWKAVLAEVDRLLEARSEMVQ